MKVKLPEIQCSFSWLYCMATFRRRMKFSWTTIKISIAGAKLSHLVQKDKIWDHGSMTEQARIIFYVVHKAKTNGNAEPLQKQCSVNCFEKLKYEFNTSNRNKNLLTGSPIVNEISIIDVRPGRNNKPDMFCAMIKGYMREEVNTDSTADHNKQFITKWLFIRQGDWWLLDDIKTKHRT